MRQDAYALILPWVLLKCTFWLEGQQHAAAELITGSWFVHLNLARTLLREQNTTRENTTRPHQQRKTVWTSAHQRNDGALLKNTLTYCMICGNVNVACLALERLNYVAMKSLYRTFGFSMTASAPTFLYSMICLLCVFLCVRVDASTVDRNLNQLTEGSVKHVRRVATTNCRGAGELKPIFAHTYAAREKC